MDPTHERSILHIRKSMGPSPSGGSRWTLVPTEETLVAMSELQEFSATEYEYTFVPLRTNVDFFILQPGEAPRRFSSPYTDFPRVTSSANPFFVAFDARPKIRAFIVSRSERWHRIFGALTMHCPPELSLKTFF
ncbi:hypothetical protein B0H12DRAFT_1134868 [Mycena haematopus]|nr:hypothetical protein B0H12DRAFT_1134868 [Mycena haematopus]